MLGDAPANKWRPARDQNFMRRLIGSTHLPLAGGCILKCSETFGPDERFFLLSGRRERRVGTLLSSRPFTATIQQDVSLARAGIVLSHRSAWQLKTWPTCVELWDCARPQSLLPERQRGLRPQLGCALRSTTPILRTPCRARDSHDHAPIMPSLPLAQQRPAPHLYSVLYSDLYPEGLT